MGLGAARHASFLIFPLFVHLFSSLFIISSLRSSFSVFQSAAGHRFSSSFIISPFRSSFPVVIHHFCSSLIIFPLRSSFSSSFTIFSLRSIIFPLRSSFPISFILSPLRSTCLLLVHRFSSSFIISTLYSSFLLFAHHVSSSFIISPLRSSFSLHFPSSKVPPVTSAGFWHVVLLHVNHIFPLRSSILLFIVLPPAAWPAHAPAGSAPGACRHWQSRRTVFLHACPPLHEPCAVRAT